MLVSFPIHDVTRKRFGLLACHIETRSARSYFPFRGRFQGFFRGKEEAFQGRCLLGVWTAESRENSGENVAFSKCHCSVSRRGQAARSSVAEGLFATERLKPDAYEYKRLLEAQSGRRAFRD